MTGRVFESAYIHWAKTQSVARFNLATSGVPAFPLARLGATMDDLEIGGPGGYGYPPLLRAIGAEYGVPVESIVLGGGTSGANQYVFSLLLGPGDEALIEHPAYDVLTCLALFTGCTVNRFHRTPDTGWGVDLGEIEARLTPRTRLIVLTNLHNPSCALLGEEALRRIGELAARVGAFVLVDEVYLDSVWDRTPPSAFHLGPNFIVTSSLTKVYGLSGLRCGWIFAPAAIAERLRRLIDLFDNIPAHPAELLSAIALRKRASIRAESRALIEGNRAIYSEFRHKYPELLTGEVPAFGTVAFPRLGGVPEGGRVPAFCERLRDAYETTVVPGHFFEMPAHVRISLVTAPDTLREGLGRMAAAWRDVMQL